MNSRFITRDLTNLVVSRVRQYLDVLKAYILGFLSTFSCLFVTALVSSIDMPMPLAGGGTRAVPCPARLSPCLKSTSIILTSTLSM